MTDYLKESIRFLLCCACMASWFLLLVIVVEVWR